VLSYLFFGWKRFIYHHVYFSKWGVVNYSVGISIKIKRVLTVKSNTQVSSAGAGKHHRMLMCTASVHTRFGFCLVGVFALLFAAPRGSAAPQESGRALRLEGTSIKKQTRRTQSRALASHRSPSRTFGPLDPEGEEGSDLFRSPPRAPRHARPPPVNTPLRSGERLLS
jgi:hypothetical protein